MSNELTTRRPQRMRGLLMFACMIACAAGAVYCHQSLTGHRAWAGQAAPADAKVARGKYLVTIMGCADCHTPMKMTDKGPAPDNDRMLSGHPSQMQLPPAPKPQGPWIWSGAATNTAFAGPWGVSFAANLTPDTNTGLGIWDEKMFAAAMRTGKHFGQARPIQPPMPWPAIAQLTDEDLSAVFAYLKSIPPIRNQVPDYQPPL